MLNRSLVFAISVSVIFFIPTYADEISKQVNSETGHSDEKLFEDFKAKDVQITDQLKEKPNFKTNYTGERVFEESDPKTVPVINKGSESKTRLNDEAILAESRVTGPNSNIISDNNESTKKYDSINNYESRQEGESTEEVDTIKNYDSTKKDESTKKYDSIKNSESTNSDDSSEEDDSIKNDESAKKYVSTKNVDSSEEDDSTKSDDSSEEDDSIKNDDSAKKFDSSEEDDSIGDPETHHHQVHHKHGRKDVFTNSFKVRVKRSVSLPPGLLAEQLAKKHGFRYMGKVGTLTKLTNRVLRYMGKVGTQNQPIIYF